MNFHATLFPLLGTQPHITHNRPLISRIKHHLLLSLPAFHAVGPSPCCRGSVEEKLAGGGEGLLEPDAEVEDCNQCPSMGGGGAAAAASVGERERWLRPAADDHQPVVLGVILFFLRSPWFLQDRHQQQQEEGQALHLQVPLPHPIGSHGAVRPTERSVPGSPCPRLHPLSLSCTPSHPWVHLLTHVHW